MRKSLFITFEGPEGSGKSTHIQLLATYLKKRGFRTLVTREPGGTSLSKTLRRILLETREGLSALAELFLYEADRAQHVEETIRPALERGELVLCDRYTDSTLAYQGDGRGLNKRIIKILNEIASQKLTPDLTLLLDVPVERGLRLAAQKKKGNDRLERAGLAFHQRVRRAYLRQAGEEPARFRVIEQQKELQETQRLIRETADSFLKTRRPSFP